MDSRLYDVFLTGKLADGLAREQAAERMAQLFKAAPATMLGLLSGKPQLLKRGVDRDTALKYREALQRAGIEVAFKPQAAMAPTSAPVQQPQAESPARPVAAAAQASVAITTAPVDTGALSLAPAGADVLNPDERRSIESAVIDTGHLSVAEAGAMLEQLPRGGEMPSIPDLGHLTLRAAEGDLLTDEERMVLPAAALDVPDFTLAPAGAELETLPDERVPVEVDIGALSLAPEGSDLLAPEQRRRFDEKAPATDHLQLAP